MTMCSLVSIYSNICLVDDWHFHTAPTLPLHAGGVKMEHGEMGGADRASLSHQKGNESSQGISPVCILCPWTCNSGVHLLFSVSHSMFYSFFTNKDQLLYITQEPRLDQRHYSNGPDHGAIHQPGPLIINSHYSAQCHSIKIRLHDDESKISIMNSCKGYSIEVILAKFGWWP